MALKKKLSANNGISAEYWKVVGFNISCTGKKCQIFLVGYIDEEMREKILAMYCLKILWLMELISISTFLYRN